MNNTEQAILKWCRATKGWNGVRVAFCMRSGGPRGALRVVDNERHDSPIIAKGDSWAEVYAELVAIGAKLDAVAQ